MNKAEEKKFISDNADELYTMLTDFLGVHGEEIHDEICKTFIRTKLLNAYFEGQHQGIKKLSKLLNEERQ